MILIQRTLILLGMIFSIDGFSQLPSNPYNHGRVRNSDLIVEDSEGGFYNIKLDNSPFSDNHIQRIGPSGNVLWDKEFFHNDANVSRSLKTIVSDNTGSIFVLASNFLSPYQFIIWKLDKNGNHLWSQNGIVVTDNTSNSYYSQLIPNNEGGVFFGWTRGDQAFIDQVYVQQLNATGQKMWGTDGIRVSSGPANAILGIDMFAPDGVGGGYVVWNTEIGKTATVGVYVQHIGASGNLLFGATGKELANSSGRVRHTNIIRNMFDEMIVTWTMEVNQSTQVYGQKIDATGSFSWPADKQLTFYTVNGHSPSGTGKKYAVPANDGGLFILHSDGWADAKLVRIGRDGTSVWGQDGISITQGGIVSYVPKICESNNAVYIAYREWISHYPDFDASLPATQFTFAQKISYSGERLWGDKGTQLCNVSATEYHGEFYSTQLVVDTQGGVFVAWRDNHLTAGPESFHAFNHVNSDGTLGDMVDAIPQNPGFITGRTDLCFGTETYSVSENAGVTINWFIGYFNPNTSVFVTEGQSQGFSTNYNFQKVGHYYVFAVPLGANGQYGPSSHLVMEVDPSATPAVIQGLDRACLVELQSNYFVQAPTVAFDWSVTGGTIKEIAGQRITVVWDAASQNSMITAIPVNGCRTGVAAEKNVTLVPIVTPSEIQSPSLVCGNTPAQYSITPISGAQYMWETSTGLFTGGSLVINPTITFSGGENELKVQVYVDGCYSTVQKKIISVSARPAKPSVSPATFESCADEPIILSTPGGFAGYHWNTEASTRTLSVSESGSYQVQVRTDNGCWSEYSAAATGIIHAMPEALIIKNGNRLTASAGSSYRWFFNDILLSNEHDQSLNAGESGSYKVVISNAFGCESESDDVLFVFTDTEQDITNQIRLYPNPAHTVISIGETEANASFKILSDKGEILETGTVKDSQIDISSLAPGAYVLQISTRNKIRNHRFVKVP